MNDESYDIITVGGGLVGAATAAVMARAGARVLVLERETVFRDRVRGEWIAPWGIAEARHLGLLDVLASAGAHELPALAGRSLKARPVTAPNGDVPLTFAHHQMQEAVLQHATTSGATVVRGATVTRVEDGQVGTLEFNRGGILHSATARLIVGADGRSSLVRRALGREPQVHRASRLLAGVRVRGIVGDPAIGYFIIREDAGGLVALFPQGNGFGRAYVFREGLEASAFSGPGGFHNFVAASVELGVPAEEFANASPVGPLAAFVADDSWIEHPAGDSLVLVGDAAGISDPTWGMGMSLALRDAHLLTEALLGASGWTNAIHRFAEQHDRDYGTVVTAENWQSDLQLQNNPEANRRRKHAMRLWSKESDRMVDLPGLGPRVDISEAARRRFYGEDVSFEVTERAAA
ncbi:MAG: FAD-dependent oxidoreductase [Dehalococcoidia bacterium]